MSVRSVETGRNWCTVSTTRISADCMRSGLRKNKEESTTNKSDRYLSVNDGKIVRKMYVAMYMERLKNPWSRDTSDWPKSNCAFEPIDGTNFILNRKFCSNWFLEKKNHDLVATTVDFEMENFRKGKRKGTLCKNSWEIISQIKFS